jgi:hypothetical protein
MSTHPDRNPILDAAFQYINEYNWTILGVGLNKRPIGEWGPGNPNRYDYSNSERIYQLGNVPGIAVVTGPSGLVIIDLDNDDAIRSWADRFGLPMTRIAKTPRGRHLYFQAPLGLHIPPGTEIMPGVDVRGAESYAILPPSVLAAAYTWHNDNPILPLPDDVIDLVTEARPKRKAKILSGEPFDEGGRNDHIFAMACSMRAGGFDYTSILAALTETNKKRCVPPLDIEEVESIAESAIAYEEGNASHIDPLMSLRAKAATLEPDDAPILATHAHKLDTAHLVDTDPDPIDWIWEGFLAPGTLSMLHGEGGLGKSWIAMKIAEQMLQTSNPTGELFGKEVRPGGVLILDGENAETQIHSRIHYTMITARADLAYYMVNDPILGLEELTEAYLDYLINKHKPRILIVDSQRALYAGDEKEQGEAGRMLRRFARWIEKYSAAFLFIHHDNRGGDYSGSSDINAAITGCRLHLTRHTDKDKTTARILTQPKNRIAAEMPRQEFHLNIDLKPRTHRAEMSGINITPYISDELAQRQQRLDTAKTLVLNSSAGAWYRDIWSAVGFEFDKDLKSTHLPEWNDLKDDLEAAGYILEFALDKDGKRRGKVRKP